jgi:hypothetical protein
VRQVVCCGVLAVLQLFHNVPDGSKQFAAHQQGNIQSVPVNKNRRLYITMHLVSRIRINPFYCTAGDGIIDPCLNRTGKQWPTGQACCCSVLALKAAIAALHSKPCKQPARVKMLSMVSLTMLSSNMGTEVDMRAE